MKIEQSEIDRACYDIVSVVSSRIQLKKMGKNYSACCPFHKEKSPSFTVSEDKAMFYCFGCGAGGDAVEFIMQYDNISFPAAIEAINGNLSSGITDNMVKQRKSVRVDSAVRPRDHFEDADGASNILESCQMCETHKYLRNNNTAAYTQCFSLKGSLIVPLFNMEGKAVNIAAINSKSEIHYSAGGISYGALSILEPINEQVFDGRRILCIDYADAWRLWWLHKGESQIMCAMSWENAKWISDKQRARFTHIGCRKELADDFLDYGHEVIIIDAPYSQKTLEREQCSTS